MEKLSEHYRCACEPANMVNGMQCGNFVTTYIPSRVYCDIHTLAARLKEYEDLEMTPKEIRKALKDADELADKFVEYYNKYIDSAFVPGEVRLSSSAFYDIIEKANRYDKIVEALRYTK